MTMVDANKHFPHNFTDGNKSCKTDAEDFLEVLINNSLFTHALLVPANAT